MAIAGKLSVVLSANSRAFVGGMKTARKEMGRFKKRGDLATRTVNKLTTRLIAFASVRGIGQALVGTVRWGDELGKTAKKLGMTTDELSAMRFAAAQTGVKAQALDMGIQRMTRRMAEAAMGTGEAKDAIKQLGLNAQALAKQGPMTALLQISDALASVESQSERVRLSFKLFDSEGVSLVNTLQDGRGELRRLMEQAEKVGAVLTQSGARRLEAVADAANRSKVALAGIKNTLIIYLAPVIEKIADKLTDFAIAIRNVDVEAVKSALNLVAWAGSALIAVKVVGRLIKASVAFIAALKGIASARVMVQALAGPAGWAALAAGIGLAAAATWGLKRAFDKVGSSVEALSKDVDALGDTSLNSLTGSMLGGVGGTVGATGEGGWQLFRPGRDVIGTAKPNSHLRKIENHTRDTAVNTRKLLMSSVARFE